MSTNATRKKIYIHLFKMQLKEKNQLYLSLRKVEVDDSVKCEDLLNMIATKDP